MLCPLCLQRAELHNEKTGACPPRRRSGELTSTQMRLLRFLLKHPDAYVHATLNEGNSFAEVDFSKGAAMFAKGLNWVHRGGQPKADFGVGSKTLVALWPKYIDQEFEESGNERRFVLTETGRAIAMEARQGGDGETRLHPKDDSAGLQGIAQKGSHD